MAGPAAPPLPAAPPDGTLTPPPGIDPTDAAAAPEGSAVKPRGARKSADEVVAVAPMPEQPPAVVLSPPAVAAPVMPSVTAVPSGDAPPSGSALDTAARAAGPGPVEATPLASASPVPPAPPSSPPPPRAEPRAARAGDGRSGDQDSEAASVHAAPDPGLAPPSPERMTAEKPPGAPPAAPNLAPPAAPSAGAARAADGSAMTVTMTVHSVSTGPGANQRITLKLAPVELGHVSVDIRAPADGPRSVALVFERADTMALFQQDQRHLAAALDRAGLPTDPGQITFSLAPPAPAAPASDPFATTAGSSDPGGRPSGSRRSAATAG